MDFTEIRDDEEDVREERPGCLRGLLKGALILVLATVVGLSLVPALLSSDGGLRWALAKVNAAAAPARVSCDKWSLGWFSPPVLTGVTVVDEARGVDAKVGEIAFDRGLLRLLPVGVLNLGTVTLKHPEISLGTASPVAGSKEKPAGGGGGLFVLPVVDGAAVVAVEQGRVSLAGESGAPFEARAISGTVTLQSCRKPIALQTQMEVGGGTVSLEGRVQSLWDFYKGTEAEQPERLSLTLKGVDLTAFGPLIARVAKEPWISSGRAEGALTAVVQGKDRFTLEAGLMVDGFSVCGGGQPRSPKGDVALMADVRYEKREIRIQKFDCSTPWVRAHAEGTLQPGDKNVLVGKVQANVTANLPAVARDFAALLGLSKGVKVQQGELRANLSMEGDATAMTVDATAATEGLSMTVDGAPLVMKPEPSLAFKGRFPYGGWPEVETLRLKAPFADVYGSGTLEAATLKGKLDLTVFSRDFKRILKNSPPMVGSAYLDVMTRRGADAVSLSALLKLSDVAAEFQPGQRTVIPQGAVKLTGSLPLQDGKPANEMQDAAFECSLESGSIKGACKRFSPAQKGRPCVVRGFTVAGDFDIGSVRRLLGGVIPVAVQRQMGLWQGHVVANATAEAAGGVLKVRMNAAGREVVAPVSNGVWRVPDVRVEGSLAQDGAKEALKVSCVASGGGSLTRDGEVVFVEKAATASVEAIVDPDGQRVTVPKLAVQSGLFDLDAQADVTERSTRCLVSAKGEAALDLKEVTRLLQAKGIDEFEMTGRERRAFRFTGPLAGGAGTALTEGTFTGSAYVGSFKGLGLQAGAADASFKLAKGVLKVAYEPALNGGRLHLLPEADLSGKMTTVTLPGKTRLLENVALTQEMVDTLLVNMNPLFQGSEVISGSVTMDVGRFRFAPEPTVSKRVLLETDIVFKQLKLRLGPSLRELLSLLKISGDTYAVDQLPAHVVIQDGRVQVDPVKMVIDQQPVIFSGWVGFDGSVKYLVEVPVSERLAGKAAGQLLRGTVIKIPVTGTVTDPQLDTRALRHTLGNLLKSAVGDQALEKVGTFLEKLQQDLRQP